MSEISSFNELFASAARRGLRLNNFFQTGDDSFRCNWRLSGGECAAFADDKTPFLAALKAFEMAVAQLLAPTTHGSTELDEDAAKLEAMGQDAGPTLDLFS